MRSLLSRQFATKTKAKFPLDLPVLSRLGVVMDENKTDEVRRLFADITGCLEDASLIAVDGQAKSRDVPSARQIVSALRQSLQQVEDQLTRIEHLSKLG